MGKRKYNRPTKEWLIQKYINEGLKTRQIADLLYCSNQIVYVWLRQYDIPRRNGFQKYEKPTKEWLENQYFNEKLSAQQIANLLNLKSDVVYSWMDYYSISRRSSGETKKLNGSMTGKNHWGYKERPSKDWLYKKYWTEDLSSIEIGKILNIDKTTVHEWLKEFNIKAKSIGETKRGNKSYTWKGGITPLYELIRKSDKYNKWRKEIYYKDKFICKKCGIKTNSPHADHIKQYALILRENNIQSLEDAYSCEELWDINNGRVLCEKCHKKTDTYGKQINIYDK